MYQDDEDEEEEDGDGGGLPKQRQRGRRMVVVMVNNSLMFNFTRKPPGIFVCIDDKDCEKDALVG